jgi:hypothetical protein
MPIVCHSYCWIHHITISRIYTKCHVVQKSLQKLIFLFHCFYILDNLLGNIKTFTSNKHEMKLYIKEMPTQRYSILYQIIKVCCIALFLGYDLDFNINYVRVWIIKTFTRQIINSTKIFIVLTIERPRTICKPGVLHYIINHLYITQRSLLFYIFCLRTTHRVTLCEIREVVGEVGDCCLTPTQQFYSYIMARTS